MLTLSKKHFTKANAPPKASRPAMNLTPLSSALWRALLRFWASANAPIPVK